MKDEISKIIIQFLNEYCTKVKNNEDSDYVELMMDNHICIEYDNQRWYIPENNILWSKEEEVIKDGLYKNFGL